MSQRLRELIPLKVKIFVSTLGSIAIIVNVAVDPRPLFARSSTPEVVSVLPNTPPYTNRITLSTNFCPPITVGRDKNFNAEIITENVWWDVLVNGTELIECKPRNVDEHHVPKQQVRFIQFRINPGDEAIEALLEYRITLKQ